MWKKEEENYNRKRYSKAHNILYLELEKNEMEYEGINASIVKYITAQMFFITSSLNDWKRSFGYWMSLTIKVTNKKA